MRKKENKRIIVLLLFVLLLVLLTGCKKEEVPAPPPTPPKKQEVKQLPPVQKPQTSAQVLPGAIPSTDFSGRKDPFKPFVVETKPVQPVFRSGSGRGLLPIQNYEVSQFKVLGIVAGLNQNSALVVDPVGKAYVVKPGMEIGKNGGRVVKITTTSIDVEEKYLDENGKLRKRAVKLTLPRKE